jgi:ubiquinone/menaquinone biosynthesis C-methylase UbiE
MTNLLGIKLLRAFENRFYRFLPRNNSWRWKIAQRGEIDRWVRHVQSKGWKKYNPGCDDFLKHRQGSLERRRQLSGIDLSQYLNSERLILDIGCGPYSLLGLARVIGVDPLIRGYGNIVDLRHDKDTIYVHSQGEKLPFADNYFDSIWCRNVLDHVQSPGLLIAEAFRVLRAEGYFVLVFDKESAGGVLHPHTELTPDKVLAQLRQFRFRILEQREVGTEYLMVVQKLSD